VPREHVDTVFDAPADLLSGLALATQRLSVAVRDAMEADGVFNAINNVVSQSVPHLHVHVVPRRRKDGLRGFFWPRTKYRDDEEAADVAASIRRRL
jgi:histidine triad (HIT) family protein